MNALAELHAALLQGVVTLGIAALCWYLFAKYRRRYVLWWTLAWSLYTLRIGAIVAFILSGAQPWLFIHQVLTGYTAFFLFSAALTYSQLTRWHPAYAIVLVFPVAWAAIATYGLENFLLAATPAVLFLSFATLWTSRVFYLQWRQTGS